MGDHRVGILVELHPLDHRAVVHSEQSTPYPDTKHPVLLLRLEPSDSSET
jgi:hypothetical protein